MISMMVNQGIPLCPSPVNRGNPCQYQSGQYVFDSNGCARKICPSLSQLCAVSGRRSSKYFFYFLIQTIRCPPDRVCRVIVCKSCANTDYLQAVCEYQKGMFFVLH